jgi:hypothetical protein
LIGIAPVWLEVAERDRRGDGDSEGGEQRCSRLAAEADPCALYRVDLTVATELVERQQPP